MSISSKETEKPNRTLFENSNSDFGLDPALVRCFLMVMVISMLALPVFLARPQTRSNSTLNGFGQQTKRAACIGSQQAVIHHTMHPADYSSQGMELPILAVIFAGFDRLIDHPSSWEYPQIEV